MIDQPQANQYPTVAVMIPEFTVSQISYRLKSLVESEFAYVKIRGEVSGMKIAPSGHAYFSLKDDSALISAVCWRGVFNSLEVKPQEGMELICIGNITTYPGQSKYQLVVEKIQHAGVGALMAMLEKRKAKLLAEGIFSQEHKQNIPFLPQRIGIITSPTGAVIKDILHRVQDRFPTHIILWPVLVQGEKAAVQVSEAIFGMNQLDEKPDVIIVARGGGSIEDLWAFNEEIVVRAAFASNIPIISAIGHETDYSLLDLVADLRAPTPTAAAEMAVPVRSAIMMRTHELQARLEFALLKFFEHKKNRLLMLQKSLPNYQSILNHFVQRIDDLSIRFVNSRTRWYELRLSKIQHLAARLKHPRDIIKLVDQRLSQSKKRLEHVAHNFLENYEQKLKLASMLLNSYSYKKTLSRGFAIILNEQNTPITSVNQTNNGEQLVAELHDGKLNLVVNK